MTTVAPVGTSVNVSPFKSPTLAAAPRFDPLVSLATTSSVYCSSETVILSAESATAETPSSWHKTNPVITRFKIKSVLKFIIIPFF